MTRTNLYFFRPYSNQTSPERPTCTDFTLQVMMTSSQLGHVYTTTPTSVSPNTRKFSRMLDQHKSVLPCKYDGISTTSWYDQAAHEARPACIDLTL